MKKELSPSLEMVACDVCGRTILKGERTEPYLVPDGSRRLVCDLCVRRAEGAGWLRESLYGDLPAATPRAEPKRSLLGRLRRRGEDGRTSSATGYGREPNGASGEPAWRAKPSFDSERGVRERGEDHEPADGYEPGGDYRPGDDYDPGDPYYAEPPPAYAADAEGVARAPYAGEAAPSGKATASGEPEAAVRGAATGQSAAPGLGAAPGEADPFDAGDDEVVTAEDRPSAGDPAGGRDDIPLTPLEELPPEGPSLEESLLREPAPEEFAHGEEAPPDPRAARRERRHRRRLRDPRHVRAVPTGAEAKVERALEIFNASDYRRTVGGLARTLGRPWVTALPHAGSTSEVTVVVAWELSWYQFRVDLGDAEEPVAVADKGHEVDEIDAELRRWNATATDDGALESGMPPA